MNPEAHLLLACMRWAARQCEPEQVRRSAQNVSDWDTFAALADAHSLSPIAADALHYAGLHVPATLRRAFLENVKRVLTLTGELLRVTRLLDTAGVSAIAFKGPVLAHSMYRDPAHRVFTDIDLLVEPQQLSLALATLASDGYEPLADSSIPQALRPDSELHLRHCERQIEIDLHWYLFPEGFPTEIPTAEAFERSQEIRVAGECVRALSPADTVLHLCAHAWKHAYVSLSLAQDLMCLNLSPQNVAAHRMIAVARRIVTDEDELCRLLSLNPYRTDALGQMRLQWRWRGNFWPTARWMLRELVRPTPAEWSTLRLPRALRFLYYPLRFARLAFRRISSLN